MDLDSNVCTTFTQNWVYSLYLLYRSYAKLIGQPKLAGFNIGMSIREEVSSSKCGKGLLTEFI